MYHRLATCTVPWGREGSGHFFCPKHRSSGSSFSVQTSSFKSPNRERMGNGTLKPTTGPWFVIAIWQTKKKKKSTKESWWATLWAAAPSYPACCIAIFPSLFYTVIKGYSEPLKMPSALIENEIEHISTEAFTAVIITACWPEQGALTDKDGF